MGALRGQVTCVAYGIEFDSPAGFRDGFLARLRGHRFRPVDVAGEADESVGWVGLRDPFDVEFGLDDVFLGEVALFAMRQDALHVPATVFRVHLQRKLQEARLALGKDRLTRSQETEARDLLRRELRRRVLPNIRLYDVVWSFTRRELYFHGASKRARALFGDLFHRTFGIEPVPREAYSVLERLGLDDEALDRAARLEPLQLVTTDGGAG